MEQNEQDISWHVKREISLGDLIAVATALVAVIVTYMNLDARVRIVEVQSNNNAQQLSSTVADLKSDLRRIADRVERIVETHNRDVNSNLSKGK